MMLPSTEISILLACIRFYLGTITVDELKVVLTETLDWKTLIQTSIDQGVMPILYESLKAIEEQHIPPTVIVQLQTLNRMNGLNNISSLQELLKILAALKQDNIDAIPFKGPILASYAYGNVALRQYNDLDILVKPQDFWRAKAVLMTLGYRTNLAQQEEFDMITFVRQITLSRSSKDAEMFNRQFQSSLLHSNLERSIDLHWGIIPRRILDVNRLERFWQHLTVIELNNQPIQTFSPEITLIIQCLNIAKESLTGRSLKQICDIVQIIKAYPAIDWHLFLQITSELRTFKLCLLWLGVIHELVALPLPDIVMYHIGKKTKIEKYIFNSKPGISKNSFHDIWMRYINQIEALDRWIDGIYITAYLIKCVTLKLLPTRISETISMESIHGSL